MESTTDRLGKLFSTLQGLDPKTDPNYVIVFVVACAIMGVICLVLDVCYTHITGKSALNLRHTWKNTPLFFVTYPIGAMVFGFFGLIVHLIQPSLFGSLAVGLTWTLSVKGFLERIAKSSPDENLIDGDEA